MQSYIPRARRWRLAVNLLGLAALGACADEPVAPGSPSAPAPNASALAGGGSGSIWMDAKIAGDTIALDAELQLAGMVYIYAPVEGGITISGKDQHRVISSTGERLILYNVTVTKGFADYGSGVSAVELGLDTVMGSGAPEDALRRAGLDPADLTDVLLEPGDVAFWSP